MLKNLIFLSFTMVLLISCTQKNSNEEQKWTSFIYPDKNNMKRSLKTPNTFSSLEKCQKSSKEYIEKNKLKEFATFKCGLNCIYHDGMKMEICEKMIQSR